MRVCAFRFWGLKDVRMDDAFWILLLPAEGVGGGGGGVLFFPWMGDHVVVDVRAPGSSRLPPEGSESNDNGGGKVVISVHDEEEPLLQNVECRICQEEDNIKNLDVPCACSGSLKFAHKECLQRWINEKGDLTCEICHESYKPGYVAPPWDQLDETAIDISGGWTISGTPLDLHDPRILAMAAAQRQFLEAEYDEYAATNSSGAAFCRAVALILMALLLLRHAMTITDGEDGDDASAVFSLFLLRVAGFLLPCYIMAWAISILQQRRQRQEAAALAAGEVAFILQAGQARGLQFSMAPESPATPQREPPQREPHQ